MNVSSDAAIQPQATTPPPVSPTRPLYWSIRRELWENRAVYLAPMAVAAAVLFGFMVSTITLPRRMNAALLLDPARQHGAIIMPYHVVAGLVMLTSFIVGVFYCLEALHGERRDRSILFWKSLPVSDRTTVLAKAAIPLAVLPVLAFVLIVASQVAMLFLSTVALLGNSRSLTLLWANVPIVKMALAILYALTTIALWHAPIYAYLVLISGWARRAAILWAFLPAVANSVLEMMIFRTSRFASLLQYRLIGWFREAFDDDKPGSIAVDPLTSLTPGNFLAEPGLWLGLILAAVCLFAAARLRRNREPN